ncbi:ABC transporter substrate-binding protein [Rhizorhabdus sp.]|uniref:ABC transporter substrate-binding protein n=1 Tax=Rhizorhabdus sp. TaxID=1968843 RepID=UPI0019CC0DD8|nr:ABC transporter substrate-binding protein [Rhizorhabdus sp.]MBD3761010.1 ABC transporter substrate-binding protein [Rhizorhabdus sp.]
MTSKLKLTLACGDYEIIRPLKEGAVSPDGIELNILTGSDSATRHWRFLRGQYDVAECSGSSYLVARDRDMPFRALPVFLHRRFRHGFVFINTGKGIEKPSDLIGRKVGVKFYQVSAILWLRGILEEHYGVPHKSIEWFAELDEDIAFDPPADLKLQRLEDSKSVEKMLADGELDALLHPDIIEPIVNKDPKVGRLFPNYKAEEVRYYQKTDIFPIMHFMGLKRELVEQHPWVVANLYQAFEQSKAMAMKRIRNPRIIPLAWYQEAWDEQEALLGPDPWEYGLTPRNRKNLETMVGYSHAQGLISRNIPLDELFLDVSQGRKRGTFRA